MSDSAWSVIGLAVVFLFLWLMNGGLADVVEAWRGKK